MSIVRQKKRLDKISSPLLLFYWENVVVKLLFSKYVTEFDHPRGVLVLYLSEIPHTHNKKTLIR